MSENLIYTSKGNLPVSELRREVKWDFQRNYIKHVEIYYHGDELVKEGADVYQLPEGTEFNLSQGKL